MWGADYNNGQEVIPSQNGKGGMWISGYDFAHNTKKLAENSIFAIVSAVDLSFKYPAEFKQLKFALDDNESQKVTHCFEAAYEFIQEQRAKTNVLVHCAAGISRSSCILISYLMRKNQITYDEAYKLVKSKRSCIQPNTGFERQLRAYDLELRKKRGQ